MSRKKLSSIDEQLDLLTGGGISSGAIKVITHETSLLADVQRAVYVNSLVGTYSQNYCIETLGVSPREYKAAVQNGAVKRAQQERTEQVNNAWLMTQVVGSENPHQIPIFP
jgi:hypothetical protein